MPVSADQAVGTSPHTGGKSPGFSTWQGGIPRDTDCPLEGDGFELPVPREIGSVSTLGEE
jgi:hypothetical protein